MTAWGAGIAKPWHERVQPTRLMQALDKIGWTGERVADEIPLTSGARAKAHAIALFMPDGVRVGTAYFREGSYFGTYLAYHGFEAAVPKNRDTVGAAATPRAGLEDLIRRVLPGYVGKRFPA